MKTPEKHTPEQFNAEIARWIRTVGVCRACGGRLESVTVTASVHSSEFGDICAGHGEVVEVQVPFCPHCEPEPKQSTCIHRPLLRHHGVPLDSHCGTEKL